ncbi:saccharopine dehydrogenase family protein [Streptomyces clavuligerus]|uniref:Saccharopine dehydrogenase n=1 Tax=Streptomyces clavuligerus TaxID=1901 RepID=E2Q093_STRCL|nr:saccharopine dehydrogenase NADP-binding domain-containing protein [Streptomyces clavuligerus]ANW17113.1 saccharopine dehydrogenase [Streptomyces clavuligerus]AXU11653.1 saccharopine dehydrogenase [Streptomyces clavuligerus]EFG10436.1 Saccharopine dehydrogenase [Streptomyces clavuligerus]MBY6301491.1 saccharopine dehydrogenase NADP-binding domain-containing protein [Streptomyces clavuligerus]QCS04433.1 saccharopine dehydrogenase [Streptomyces clavuligerus]
MRILALGGPGAMGAVAVRVAAGLPGVTEIVVADRRMDTTEALVRRLAGRGAPMRPLCVDVTDEAALRAAMEQADIVLNTVGPYYRFGMAVLRAALTTRTHYLDICDDWEPTQRMLELDGAARATGVCAVVGMGASPGVSNLLAARAVDHLDQVRDLYTAWPVDVSGRSAGDDGQLLDAQGGPSAAAVHWMEQISGEVAVVSEGRLVRRRPLRPVTLTVSAEHSGTAYTVGHPEPVTLHRSFRPGGEAANLMVVTPGTAAYLDVLRRDIDAGRLTNERAAADLAGPSLFRTLCAAMGALTRKGPGSLPPFFAAATGTRDGRSVTVLARLAETPGAASLIEDMAEATGIPLALGLAQLLDGSRVRPGVHPPETVIDAERFFADLAREVPALAGDGTEPGGVVVEVTETGRDT